MIEQFKHQLIEYGKFAREKGYTPGISGNISARIGEDFIITSSGSANGYLVDEDFSIVDAFGNPKSGNMKPSSERFLHLDFYRQRPDICCVFHMHSPYLTAFAASGVALEDAISPEIVYCFGKIPLAKYALPGSEVLVEKTSIYFKDFDVILLENHGVIVGGSSVKETFLKLELAEEYAKTLLFAKLLGGAKILPEDEVQKIYSLRQK